MQNSSTTPTEKDKLNSKTKTNTFDTGSSGDSTSTVSSGEHLSDLCLSPSDTFDIEQSGAGMKRVRFLPRMLDLSHFT